MQMERRQERIYALPKTKDLRALYKHVIGKKPSLEEVERLRANLGKLRARQAGREGNT